MATTYRSRAALWFWIAVALLSSCNGPQRRQIADLQAQVQRLDAQLAVLHAQRALVQPHDALYLQPAEENTSEER